MTRNCCDSSFTRGLHWSLHPINYTILCHQNQYSFIAIRSINIELLLRNLEFMWRQHLHYGIGCLRIIQFRLWYWRCLTFICGILHIIAITDRHLTILYLQDIYIMVFNVYDIMHFSIFNTSMKFSKCFMTTIL